VTSLHPASSVLGRCARRKLIIHAWESFCVAAVHPAPAVLGRCATLLQESVLFCRLDLIGKRDRHQLTEHGLGGAALGLGELNGPLDGHRVDVAAGHQVFDVHGCEYYQVLLRPLGVGAHLESGHVLGASCAGSRSHPSPCSLQAPARVALWVEFRSRCQVSSFPSPSRFTFLLVGSFLPLAVFVGYNLSSLINPPQCL
jgi:hypothetical protein